MLVRRLPYVALLGALPLVLAHCSSDDDPADGTAGTSAAGQGGTTAAAGTGGSGPAGSGGSAGTATGGTGSVGGTGPAGGTGAVGGTGPAGGTGAVGGTGPAGGTGPVGGTGPSGGTGPVGGTGPGGGTGPAGGTGAGGMAGAPQGGSGGSGGGGAFALTSPDHAEGAAFGDKYTCALAGFNGSLLPELNWTAGPAGTQSYAITFIDRTLAAEGNANGYHWVIWNIPAATRSLPEEFKDAASIGAMQTGNYLGPCPNFGSANQTDTYEFTIYALDTATIDVPANSQFTARVMAADDLLEADHLAKATLSGTSDASPP